jgi:hypothetical protein
VAILAQKPTLAHEALPKQAFAGSLSLAGVIPSSKPSAAAEAASTPPPSPASTPADAATPASAGSSN